MLCVSLLLHRVQSNLPQLLRLLPWPTILLLAAHNKRLFMIGTLRKLPPCCKEPITAHMPYQNKLHLVYRYSLAFIDQIILKESQ